MVYCKCHENTKQFSLSNWKTADATCGIVSVILSLLPLKLTKLKVTVLENCQGIIVFASVMATLGLQVILESARLLVSKVQHGFSTFDPNF